MHSSRPRPYGSFFYALQIIAAAGLLLLTIPIGKTAADFLIIPHSPPLKNVLPDGMTLVVPEHPEGAFAAEKSTPLRQYLFARHANFDRPELIPAGGIVPVSPGVTVRTLRTDADMVRVLFLDGELAGRELWMQSKPLIEVVKRR